MRTELSKPSTQGFMLTEQELRRIHDTIMQQMKRTGRDVFSSLFELRYKNGVRAEKASLDEIIADANSGVWAIQGLKMALVFKRFQPQETQIEIEFRVPPHLQARSLRSDHTQYNTLLLEMSAIGYMSSVRSLMRE